MTKTDRDNLRRLGERLLAPPFRHGVLAGFNNAALGALPGLLDSADLLDELVEALPRCSECDAVAEYVCEDSSDPVIWLYCRKHLLRRTGLDDPDVSETKWASIIRRLEEK